MKIASLTTRESVRVKLATEQFFGTSLHKDKFEIEFDQGFCRVKPKNGEQIVYIPISNVLFFVPELEITSAKALKKAA